MTLAGWYVLTMSWIRCEAVSSDGDTLSQLWDTLRCRPNLPWRLGKNILRYVQMGLHLRVKGNDSGRGHSVKDITSMGLHWFPNARWLMTIIRQSSHLKPSSYSRSIFKKGDLHVDPSNPNLRLSEEDVILKKKKRKEKKMLHMGYFNSKMNNEESCEASRACWKQQSSCS